LSYFQIIDRSYNSAYEHLREKVVPKLKKGEFKGVSNIPDVLAGSTYSPKAVKNKIADNEKYRGRVNVTNDIVTVVCKYLLEVNGKPSPTSIRFWEEALLLKVKM